MEKLTFEKALEKVSQLETTDVYSYHVDNEKREIRLVLNNYNGVDFDYVVYRVYDDGVKVEGFCDMVEENALEEAYDGDYVKYSLEDFTVMLGHLSDVHDVVNEEQHREFAQNLSFNKYTLVKVPSNLYTMELTYQLRKLGYKTSVSLTTTGTMLMVAK